MMGGAGPSRVFLSIDGPDWDAAHHVQLFGPGQDGRTGRSRISPSMARSTGAVRGCLGQVGRSGPG